MLSAMYVTTDIKRNAMPEIIKIFMPLNISPRFYATKYVSSLTQELCACLPNIIKYMKGYDEAATSLILYSPLEVTA